MIFKMPLSSDFNFVVGRIRAKDNSKKKTPPTNFDECEIVVLPFPDHHIRNARIF